jgi:TonB family protein
VLGWLIVSGAIVRLSWTALGLWRIHQHKVEATPLYPLPESIQNALLRVGASAAFCISPGRIGPVTFGFLRPIVLLPESFLSLEVSAQCSIACHELLHVRRHDWLMTLIEELGAALFWFHPALWWLLGQTRLSREQIVDAEVVRIVADREPYIHALLTMANVQAGLDLEPAPLFLRRRHLLQRMHSLLLEASMSKFRLLLSYSSMMAILTAVAWMGFVSFPLTGRAEIKEAVLPARVPAVVPVQNAPGYVVNIQPLSYPADAIQKKIEGTVAVELTFNADGRIVDSHVLSGPDELRASALESALKGSYSINVARTLQVLVDFKLANARVAGQRGGVLGGNVLRNVLPVPGTPPPPPPPPPLGPALNLNNANAVIDSIDIRGLSDPQLSDLRQRMKGLEGQTAGQALGPARQAVRDSGVTTNYALFFRPNGDKVTLTVTFGNPGEPQVVRTPFGDAVVQNGTVATPFGPAQAAQVPTVSPISTVDPVYPQLAQQVRIQGVVILQLSINSEGKVENVRVVSGHPLLLPAAVDAVKQWVYPPSATVTNAFVNFTLPPQ